MTDDVPKFIPEARPDNFLLDLSHSLSPASVSSLKPIVEAGAYTPKVLILPATYVSPDTGKLTEALVGKWHINDAGKTLLIVVDLKAHKVHAHGSPDIANAGVTSEYISNSLIPEQFVPSMKKGDLTTALKRTLVDVSSKVTASPQRTTQALQITQAKVPDPPISDFAVNSILLTLVLLPLLVIAMIIQFIRTTFFGGTAGNGSNSGVFRNFRTPGFWNGGGHQPLGSWSNNSANDYTSSSDSYSSGSSSNSSSSDSSSSSSDSSSSDSSSGSDGSGSW